MIRWLQEAHVDDVILAVNHFSDRLAMELGTRRLGSKIIFSVERTPLGTGGPIRLAREILKEDESFLVVNGDIVTDIDLSRLVASHENEDADATIALVKVPDPRPFGSVSLDSKDRIVRFVEKSSRNTGEAWVNAGVYVLNPRVIKRISSKRFVSLERDIFPAIARRLKMQGWKHHGLWYDIGNVPDYLRANMELLHNSDFRNGSLNTATRTSFVRTIEQPTFVGKKCKIDRTARLGPDTILSEKVTVKGQSVLSSTIVFEETAIGENCQVRGSIIGERVTIGDRTRIGVGSIIAGQIRLPEDSKISARSVILN
jgi:NDP-sugar pyrophosphorylase family protein